MFIPNYTISNEILSKLKAIAVLAAAFEKRPLSEVVLLESELRARELSAYASTSIEGNPLPLTEVKKLLKSHPQNLRHSEREVLNYNEALKFLHQKNLSAKKEIEINESFILLLHNKVMNELLPDFNCGQWRKEPVFVNDPKLGKPIFYPPDYKDVPKLMADLIEFVSKSIRNLDAVLLAGIFHKQMILIHPFLDGNGRTTRLVTKMLLSKLGVDTFPLFSFENFYNLNVTRYFAHVGERGDYYELAHKLDFTNWLNYFAEGILDEMLRVQKSISQFDIVPERILKEHHKTILKIAEENGFVNDQLYAKAVDRSKASRALDFKKLLEMGLIKREGAGKNTIYKLVNPT